MKIEDKLKLSFYKELTPLNEKGNAILVQHIETGKLFVKKYYTQYNDEVYDLLLENNFKGVPKFHLTIKDDEQLIVIEDFINGSTIYDLIEKHQKIFTTDEAINIMTQLCDIIYQLHCQYPPMVHRDIKASNIILTDSNTVYLIDYNISRIEDKEKTHDTQIMGTYGYAAPEQFGFMQCTPKSDIYSMGVLLKYILSGNIDNIQKYNGPLANTIKKATEIDPQNRYTNVKQLKKDLNLKKNGTKFTFPYKKQLLLVFYFVILLSSSYEIASSMPEIPFFRNVFYYMIIYFSPILYALVLKYKNIKFRNTKWNHKLKIIILCFPFTFIIALLASLPLAFN